MNEERRRSARASQDLQVVIHFDDVDEMHKSSTADISRHGAYIRTRERIEIGTRVYLDIDVGNETLVLDGRVVRTGVDKEGEPGIGIDFQDVGPLARERLYDLVRAPGKN